MTVLERLEIERRKYGPTITPLQAVEILNAVAWDFRLDAGRGTDIGLLSAPPGSNGAAHPNGRIKLDILADRIALQIFDVFIDGPDANAGTTGRAAPAWQEKGPLELSRFVRPVKPITLPGSTEPTKPDESTTTEAPGAELAVLEELLPALERIVETNEANTRAVLELSRELATVNRDGVRFRLR